MAAKGKEAGALADLDGYLAKLYTATPLTEREVEILTAKATEILASESNVQPVPAPEVRLPRESALATAPAVGDRLRAGAA